MLSQPFTRTISIDDSAFPRVPLNLCFNNIQRFKISVHSFKRAAGISLFLEKSRLVLFCRLHSSTKFRCFAPIPLKALEVDRTDELSRQISSWFVTGFVRSHSLAVNTARVSDELDIEAIAKSIDWQESASLTFSLH